MKQLGSAVVVVLLVGLVLANLCLEARCNDPKQQDATIDWLTDYTEALQRAETEGRMMFIFFYHPGVNRLRDHFEANALADRQVREKLRDYVCARLSTETTIRIQGKRVRLLDHEAFAGMKGHQGIAILDLRNRRAEYYGCVVSTFPFTEEYCYSARQVAIIVDLGSGRPEQRWAEYVARVSKAHQQRTARPAPIPVVVWMRDYAAAVERADHEGKMLLVYFCSLGKDELCRRFETESLSHPSVVAKLQEYVCLWLPLEATVNINGKRTKLLEHEAFREMLGRPGIAIIDYKHKQRKYYGHVVSTFPLTGKLWYDAEKTQAMLGLPPGTLTQRTLIWAVRVHPDRPASTTGEPDPTLMDEAERHSQYQARIGVQGHHHWGVRFQRIIARLPDGMTASEVCAESWPGENLVEAAVECVRCWRLSQGHWSAVRAAHRLFGYDMKRGENGIWYATGIFGRY